MTMQTDTFNYDFNGAAEAHESRELDQFNTSFAEEFARLSSNVKQQVMAIRNNTELSYDEKIERLRSLGIVNGADYDQLRQAATALEQNQSLSIGHSPSSHSSPATPAEQNRLVKIETEARNGLTTLARVVEGASVIEEDGQVDIAATLTQITNKVKDIPSKTPAKPANTAELTRLVGEQQRLTTELIAQRKITETAFAALHEIKPKDDPTKLKKLAKIVLKALKDSGEAQVITYGTTVELEAIRNALNNEEMLIKQLDDVSKKITAELGK